MQACASTCCRVCSARPRTARQAAWAAVAVYLALDAAPAAAAASAKEEEAALAALSPDERKRFKQHRRKVRPASALPGLQAAPHRPDMHARSSQACGQRRKLAARALQAAPA